MSKRKMHGDRAIVKQQCNSFVEIDSIEFQTNPRKAISLGLCELKQLQFPVGTLIELIHSDTTVYGGSIVRVFQLVDFDGRFFISYGSSTRDYKWEIKNETTTHQ